MKKILLLISMILITNVADARMEYYASIKAGAGDTTIYVDGDKKIGDYLVKELEIYRGPGLQYDDSGLLWEISPAIGIDWAMNLYGWFHLRLEGELGYNHYREDGTVKKDYAITDRVKVKSDQIFLLANGYADFRIDKVIPYVGLGLGYGFGRDGITVDNLHESTNDSGIIYALHLGVGYKYSDITTFDLGLRRVYVPVEDDGQYDFDTIRLGARFRI